MLRLITRPSVSVTSICAVCLRFITNAYRQGYTLRDPPARLGNNSNKLEYLRYDTHDIVESDFDFVDRDVEYYPK